MKTFVPGEVATDEPKEEEPAKQVGPTPEQIIAIKVLLYAHMYFYSASIVHIINITYYVQAAIVNSQTLEEVARLEKVILSSDYK